jgi:hypothetical protein
MGATVLNKMHASSERARYTELDKGDGEIAWKDLHGVRIDC